MPPPASAFSASSLTTEAAYLVGERLMRIWSEPGGLANRLLNRELLIPAVAASVSCGVLLLSLAASCVSGLRNPNGVDSGADSEQARDTSPSSLRERVLWHVKARRGTFNYQLLRLVLGLALLVLAACEENVTPNSFSLGQIHLPFFKWLHSNRHASLTSLSLSITYLYAVLLGFMTLFANKSWSSTTSRHSTFIYSSTFIVYAYRDMYPLATFTHIPKDNVEGLLLWFKILLLFLSGVAIPLVVPREYVPFDSKNRMEPNPEQTASLFSMLTYSFMSPIVYLAYRLPHLSYNQLPPLADYDYAHNLKSGSFKHLDLFSGAPHRHIFWGLMQVFRFEYTAMSILIALMVFASFVSPIGINFLLRYLEGEASPADLKPWVWILLLFLGPLSASLCWQGYIFFATRALVRCEAIITQLVFEHSLRIRVKAETEKGVQSPGSNVANDSSATATVVEAFDENAQSEVSDNGTEHSRDATAVSTQTTSAETVLASSSSVKSTSSKRSQQGQNIKPEGPPAGTSNASNLVGRINNLVTTDLGNITDARNLTFVVVYIPLQITLCMVFLYILLGWSAFVGLGVMIALYPLPGIVAKKIQQVQKMRLKRTDARVQTVTEAMNVLRMIKLFGWENKMQDRISEKREEELLCLWQLQILELINGNVTYDKVLLTSDECGLLSPSYAIPIIVMVATLFTYSMTVFDLMRDQLFMAFWMVNSVIAGKVSLDRVNEFLKEASKSTELLDAYTDKEQAAFLPQLDADDPRIGFNDATFTWSIDTDGALTPSKRKYLLKIDGELLFKRNALNLIVGPTGSGKTSMLMALLNEMHYIPAGPGSWFNLPRRGGVAYAAQESWVQNETIKENILFGSPCDEERYRKVLHQCGLERDLELFEAGDLTEVGEKGLTLSGGQKARVTLARAIYSPAEIILLDDVLAALDVHTAKWIVDKCLGGDLVRDRTVLLVTHNIAMVRSLAGFAVSIGTDGCIVAHGTVDSVLGADEAISRVLEENKESIEMASEVVDKPQTAVPPTDGKLIVAEEIEVGHVSWKSVKLFLLGLGGSHPGLFFLSFLGGLFISDLISTFQTWFLGYWASQYETHHPSDVSVPYYLTIYVSLLFAAVTFYMSGYTVFIFGVVRASRVLHQKLIQSVLGTTLRWLDTTPTSRILTRCTQDIRAVDGPLKDNGKWLTEITVTMMTKLGAVVFMTPIFLVPGMIVGAIGGWIGQIYMAAQLSVKREMSNAKAPVVGHFGAAIAGLTSIRAYSAEEAFIAGSLERINRYTRAARVFYNLNRWVCVRIDTIGGLFAAALGTYLVYIKPSSPSSVGFSLNMAVSFSSLILYWIRHFNDFEVQGNSLERIQGYINIEQEKKPSREGEPPAYWPASGSLVVSNLSAKYSPSSPKVLRDISFEIKSGERVGIVGRTGSGKSSLTLALLKCIFTEGSVIYDGVETSNLNLDALRSNVTIIPQIPELLSGSLRHNLDPFDQYDDVTLNDALRAAGLFALQADMEDGRITLDSSIASGGGNLSVGQRQILALARAIVRGSRLLILDEATSAIDHKTDTAIQMSLRHELGRDTTVITIAHRLQTIMDADKIMVLDAGEIVEFDSPSNLLDIEKGFLRSLVEESGDRQHLYDMAKGKHYDESR